MRGIRFARRGVRRRLIWVAALSAAALAGCAPASDYSALPVLFVHGHGLEPTDGDSLLRHLRDRGYPEEFLAAVDIEPSRLDNVSAAERFIAPAVDELLARASDAADAAGEAGGAPQRVALVAHSMGAVSARWYARARPERVAALITVAGANHGSNALCRHTDAGADDLCPAFAATGAESAIQLELNGSLAEPRDETPYGFGRDGAAASVPADDSRAILYLTVRLATDPWIVPAESAVLDGAGGLELGELHGVRETSTGNYLLDAAEDHVSLLANRDVHRVVEAALASRRLR